MAFVNLKNDFTIRQNLSGLWSKPPKKITRKNSSRSSDLALSDCHSFPNLQNFLNFLSDCHKSEVLKQLHRSSNIFFFIRWTYSPLLARVSVHRRTHHYSWELIELMAFERINATCIKSMHLQTKNASFSFTHLYVHFYNVIQAFYKSNEKDINIINKMFNEYCSFS